MIALRRTFGDVLADRLAQQRNASIQALIVTSSDPAHRWHRLGATSFLVPGLAIYQVRSDRDITLVIDEDCVRSGPWAGLTSSSGEVILGELETVRSLVAEAGGLVIGILDPSLVPDVNTQRLRRVYDVVLDEDLEQKYRTIPRVVRELHEFLYQEGERHGQ